MSLLLPIRKKKELILIHTLSNKTIKVPQNNIRIVSELKHAVCKGSCVAPDEITIVCKGGHLDDDQDISYFSMDPIYAYIKCTSHRNITLRIKHAGSQSTGQFECPLNSKISRVKHSLTREDMTTIRPCEQRAIINGQVLKDHNFIGDYLLHLKVKSTKAMKQYSPQCTVVLSQTVNPLREIDIALEMPNSCINFSFPIGEALYYAKRILFHQFGVPNDLCYNFCHESGVVLADHETLLGRGLVPTSTNEVKLSFTVLTELMLGPHHILSLPASLLAGESNTISGLREVTEPLNRSHPTGDPPRGTTPRTSSEDASQPLFKGLKKGFLSSSSSKPAATSSISVTHPATAAAARREALNTKDIWQKDEIPYYEELASGEWRTTRKKRSCKKRERPVRNASTLSSRFAKAIAKEAPNELKDKKIKTGERIRESTAAGVAPSKQPEEPVFNIRYKQQDGVLVKSFSPGICTHVVIKVHFPQSKLADIDLNVTMNKLKVASPLHRLITPLLVDVHHRQAKAKFDPKREILTVTLPVML